MYSSVLGGRLAGIGVPNLRLYHAAMNIPPPPTGPSFQRIQKDLLIAADYVANMSMMEAKIGYASVHLESLYLLLWSDRPMIGE